MAWWWPFGRKARTTRDAKHTREPDATEAAAPVPVGARVAGREDAPATRDDSASAAKSATAETPAEGQEIEFAAESATAALPAEHDEPNTAAESATVVPSAGDDNAATPAESATSATVPAEHDETATAAESATATMAAGGDDGANAAKTATTTLPGLGNAADVSAKSATAATDVVLDALEAGLGDAAAVHRVLRAHAALLVTDAAQDRARARVGAARTAGDQEREARAVAVLGIVTGLRGMAPAEVAPATAQDDPAAEEELQVAAEALQALLTAPTWDEARRVLAERRAALLSDAALALLREAIAQQRDAKQEEAAGELERHLHLLERARDEGDDAAFAALEGELDGEGVDDSGEVPTGVRDILAQLEPLTRLEDMPARIALLEQALALVTRQDNRSLWAALQVHLGNALAQNRPGDQHARLQRAIGCYDAALLEYSRALMPTDHRRIAQSVGMWLFGEGRWAEAARFLGMALDALDDRFTLAVTARGRESVLAAGGELSAHLAYALVRAGGPGAALAAARALERGRARATGEAVQRRRAEIATAEARVAPKLLAAFHAAAARLASFTLDDGRTALDAPGDGAGAAALAATAAQGDRYEQAKQARADYDAAAARIREHVPSFLVPADPLPAAARALRPDERLGYMASTPAGSVLALVGGLAEDTEEPAAQAWWDEGLTRALVVDLLERTEGQGDQRHIVGGLLPAQYRIGSLRDALEEAMGALGMPSGVLAELAARCRALAVARVVLVPGGLLGLLPLHAALVPPASAGAEPEPLLDHVRVSYAPSAAVWLACRERAVAFTRTAPRALVVGDPLPQPAANPLPGAKEEARKVFAVVERDADGQARLIERVAAERKVVLAALGELAPELTHAHFACHGEANITHPLDSGLLMANGARLMVRDLIGGGVPYLSRLRLAGISACQTALQGARLPDEAVGLPAGWLRAGAIGVLGSLWPISDDATVALITRFYELHLLDGLEPADALWLAQRWLRGLPRGERRGARAAAGARRGAGRG